MKPADLPSGRPSRRMAKCSNCGHMALYHYIRQQASDAMPDTCQVPAFKKGDVCGCPEFYPAEKYVGLFNMEEWVT